MNANVIAAVDDMLFVSKIRAVAEHLGLTVHFVKSVAAAIDAARADRPSVIIADLHSQRCQPLDLARELKADAELRSVPLVGFFSHVDTVGSAGSGL